MAHPEQDPQRALARFAVALDASKAFLLDTLAVTFGGAEAEPG